MHSFRFSRYKAFTLVEVMVVIAIFTIVIGAAYALMASGRMSWYSGDARIELQEDLRQAMDVMTYELSASAPTDTTGNPIVTIGGVGSFITFQVPVDENASGSWEDTDGDLQPDFYLEDTLDPLNNDNIRWGAYLRGEDRTVPSGAGATRAGRWIRYILVGDELRRRILSPGGGTLEDFVLAYNVQNLNFVRPASNVIVITVDARKLTIDRHPVNYSLSTTVYLKSKE